MVLLDIQTQAGKEDTAWVIWLLAGLIVFLTSTGCAMIGILHRGITKRQDKMEGMLEIFLTTVAEHKVEIKGIKEDVLELKQWQGHYDGRLQRIERHPALSKS